MAYSPGARVRSDVGAENQGWRFWKSSVLSRPLICLSCPRHICIGCSTTVYLSLVLFCCHSNVFLVTGFPSMPPASWPCHPFSIKHLLLTSHKSHPSHYLNPSSITAVWITLGLFVGTSEDIVWLLISLAAADPTVCQETRKCLHV